jgi:hypothetical protein
MKLKSTTKQRASGLGSTVGTVGSGQVGLPTNSPQQTVTAPAPAGATPMPDPALMQQQATANNNVRLGDAWATYQTGQINADYGFTPQGQIDPNNPYSRAALLQRSYQDSQRGTTNSYASAGQYNSGAYSRMRGRNTENFDIGLDQLKKSQGREQAGVVQQQVQNYSTNMAGLDPAKLESILKALGF